MRKIIGTTADGTAVTGKIEIPEVAHDTDEDDYVVSLGTMKQVSLLVANVAQGLN